MLTSDRQHHSISQDCFAIRPKTIKIPGILDPKLDHQDWQEHQAWAHFSMTLIVSTQTI